MTMTMMMLLVVAAVAVATSVFTKTDTTIHGYLYKNFCWLKIAEIVFFFFDNFVHLAHRFKWSKFCDPNWWQWVIERMGGDNKMINGFETMCTNWLERDEKNSILPVYVYLLSFFFSTKKNSKYAWWQRRVIINCSYSKLQKNHHVTHSNL